MAVNRKGKQVVEAKTAPFSPAAAASAASASSCGGKRKRPLSAASTSAPSSRGGGSGGSASGRRKRGRAASSRFIDDAAVDADDEEEEFDDDDGDGESGEEADPEFVNDDPEAGVKNGKGAGKSNMLFFLKEEELSGDELEELVNERYGHGSDHVMYEEDDKEYDDRRSLLHSADEPTIWRIRCMVGHERHIAFCLIQKYVSLRVRGSTLPIISVFSLEHIKGYVFIEAEKQHDVAEACKGFCTMYTSKIGLVPSNEVPRLLSIQNKTSEIADGTWVRMKSGKYKGDLAQIVAVDNMRKRATVKLVPRIDLQALAKKFGGGISLKEAAIPAPRLINSRELEDFRPHIELRRDRETGEVYEILDGLMLKDGYLYKKVSILSLNCFGVQPSSTELMKFEPAKRDEPQVSEYISQLYGEHKRNSLERSDNGLEDEGNKFKLHDLVMFGRKDFGVVIAMKCDSIQILKGGMEEQVVITVHPKDIKSSCIDKMFTASDCHKKTIFINDTVKVLEGPQKDRQGIVKHMYKGTLFVYDEENSENTGFFCVKSGLCELMKDHHKNMGHKSFQIGSKGSGECSTMPQSPTKCSRDRDYDSGFKGCHRGDRDQPFTVGQTLRIRVGPLKGYLCRVVRIYRSDVTVKLDSLLKLITVNCNQLSDANIKSFGNTRVDTMSKPDEVGLQERISKGEVVHGDADEPLSKSSWDFELPSSTRPIPLPIVENEYRVSWAGLSTWGGSSGNCDDNKGNDQGDDPWGSKVTSGDRCQAGHSDNAAEQSAQPAGVDGWSNWAKAEKSTEVQHESWKGNRTNEDEKGGWGKAMSSTHGQADSWDRGAGASGGSDGKGAWGGHGDRPGCSEARQGFGNDWGKASTDGWSNQVIAEKSTKDEKNWKGDNVNGGETGGWNKAMPSNNGHADNWNRGAGGSGESKGKGDCGNHTNKPGHFERGQGFGSNSGKVSVDGCSNQDKAEKLTECEHESWKGKSISECETGGWSKAVPSNHGQADGWNTGAGDSGEANSKGCWGGHTNNQGHFEVGQGSSGGWAKATTDGWSSRSKAEKSTDGLSESWKGNNNEGDAGGWSKVKTSNHDNAGGWNKGTYVSMESGGKVDWGGCTDRLESFEAGQGFGSGGGSRGSRGKIEDGNQGGGWSKGPDVGGVYGSSWSRGRSGDNETCGSGDRQDCWNRSRDSDGRWGRGRGRGFYGSGRGRNQYDSWKGPSGSDASWSSGRGRGRGRGRSGRGAWEGRGSRDDHHDSSRSVHDSKDHSFGSKNDRGNAGHGDSSGDALSSWKSGQPSGWGASTAFGKDKAFDDKKDKSHSWGEKGTCGGGSSSWNSGREGHSVPRNEGGNCERNEKPDINQGCSSNSGWGSVKLAVGSDKHGDGEQPTSWQKEATYKWSSPEVCKNKQLSWGHAPGGGEKATDEDWSIKSKQSTNQSGGDPSVTGLQSTAWDSKSSVNEKVGKAGESRGSSDIIQQSGGKEESTWGTAAGDNWEKGSISSGRKNSESDDGHPAKECGGAGSSVWGQQSSGDERGKDAGGGLGGWDNQKPSGYGSNWNSQEFGGGSRNSPNPSAGGKQASGWQNDEGSNWSRPKQNGGHSSGRNNWLVGDGARGNDGRCGGNSFGGGLSSGWKGNVSSGRGNGRGRGKYFGEEQASGWSGGTQSNKEAGGSNFSFSDRQGSCGRSKPTWTHDRFAYKGNGSREGHGVWGRGKDLAEGSSGDAKMGVGGEEGWRQEAKGTWGSRDSGTGNQASGSDKRSDCNNPASGCGWASWTQGGSNQSNAKASAQTTTSQGVGWEKKECLDGAQGSGVSKSDAIPSKQAGGEACQGTDNWNEPKGFNTDTATGWTSASMSSRKAVSGEDQGWNQKMNSDGGVDTPGGKSNAERQLESSKPT